MGTVTKWRARGSFAATKVQRSVFICFVCDGRELRVAMGAVAERLIFALSTRAPKVLFAGCYVDRERRFLCNIRFGHGLFLVLLHRSRAIVFSNT